MRKSQNIAAVSTLYVGLVGHRWNRLARSDEEGLRGRLREAMLLVDSAAGLAGCERIILVAGTAEGADILASEERPMNWQFQAVPPVHNQRLDYLAQALDILKLSDLLLTLWDGRPGQGPGGTADSVASAFSSGLPVLWVDSRSSSSPLRLVTGLGTNGPVWCELEMAQLQVILGERKRRAILI